ncbi:MAG TPA: FtsX-like permease family protein, partial [Bacteroidales bacterium]|nr:FtsX-like permease family protein [Bacteroidales bacterium]
ITHQNRQHLVTMRGVQYHYATITGIDTMLVAGDFVLDKGDADFFVIGQGVEYVLGANIHDFMNPFNLYVPRRGRTPGLHPSQAFKATSNFASGVFGVQAEFDMGFVLVPIRLARQLLDYNTEVSSLVLGLDENVNEDRIQKEIQNLVGPAFEVRNRLQQQDFLYRIMRTEKWAIFFILTFILIIASFNVIGSLTMLVIEKTRDIQTLHSMGASQKLLRKIFLVEGIMISLGGALVGILIGVLISWLQMQFGFISIQAQGTFVIDAYPVVIKVSDLLKIALTVFGIGVLASILPVKNIALLIHNKQ